MRTKRWPMVFALGLGLTLTLALLWVLGMQTKIAVAAPVSELHVCPAGPPTCGYATVQEAVDVANAGDVIKVASGIYDDVNNHGGLSQVVYVSKSVTIRGGYATTNWDTPDQEANPTTLDAQGQGRVVYITGVISLVLEGLRITDGNAASLGGGHWGEDTGGGVYVMSAAATLEEGWKDCRVFGNTAQAGGGLYLQDSAATLSGNLITSNSALSSPGGSYGDGGGLFLNNSAATLSENFISSNTAGYSGSGLYLGFGSNATLANNVVADNQIADGLHSYDCGLYVAGSSPQLLHNTVARNTGGGGSGVCVDSWPSPSTVVLNNTILVGQATGIHVAAGSTARLEATLWGGGGWANGSDWTGAGTITTGAINIRGNPGFVDPAEGDYPIDEGSAARDAGVNAGVTIDMDGEARPQGAGYDIGADEWHPEVTATPTPTYTPTATAKPTDTPTPTNTPTWTPTHTPTMTPTATPPVSHLLYLPLVLSQAEGLVAK